MLHQLEISLHEGSLEASHWAELKEGCSNPVRSVLLHLSLLANKDTMEADPSPRAGGFSRSTTISEQLVEEGYENVRLQRGDGTFRIISTNQPSLSRPHLHPIIIFV
jgi:hypothetical protein